MLYLTSGLPQFAMSCIQVPPSAVFYMGTPRYARSACEPWIICIQSVPGLRQLALQLVPTSAGVSHATRHHLHIAGITKWCQVPARNASRGSRANDRHCCLVLPVYWRCRRALQSSGMPRLAAAAATAATAATAAAGIYTDKVHALTGVSAAGAAGGSYREAKRVHVYGPQHHAVCAGTHGYQPRGQVAHRCHAGTYDSQTALLYVRQSDSPPVCPPVRQPSCVCVSQTALLYVRQSDSPPVRASVRQPSCTCVSQTALLRVRQTACGPVCETNQAVRHTPFSACAHGGLGAAHSAC
jgi:hypothetical protein